MFLTDFSQLHTFVKKC